MVGQIAAVGGDGKVSVTPYVDWARLDWVTVLRTTPLPSPDDGETVASAGSRSPRR
jgi:hypothetical protein